MRSQLVKIKLLQSEHDLGRFGIGEENEIRQPAESIRIAFGCRVLFQVFKGPMEYGAPSEMPLTLGMVFLLSRYDIVPNGGKSSLSDSVYILNFFNGIKMLMANAVTVNFHRQHRSDIGKPNQLA